MNELPVNELLPVSCQAAWYGHEMRGSDSWIDHLDSADIALLDAGLEQARRLGLTAESLQAADFPIGGFVERIGQWRQEINGGRGFVLVKGLPVHRYSEAETAIVYCGIGAHLGRLVSQNAQGDLLGHVRDDGSDPADPGVRLYRTRARQDFHTDGADVVGLLCLAGAKRGGESRIVSSTTVYNEVLARRPDLAPLMFEPWYWDRHDEQPEGELPYWEFPMCRFVDGRINMFFVGWYIRQAQRHAEVPRLTPEQNALIELIEAIANDPDIHLEMAFEPGDIQLLKNATILHAREAYEDWDDPLRRRHLLRLWLAARDDGFRGIAKKIS